MIVQPKIAQPTSSATYENLNERVIHLINIATLASTESERIAAFKEAQDHILYKDPSLLERYFNDILAFQSDPSLDIKKSVISFIEESCKRNPQNLGKSMGHLNIFLRDNSPIIQKKVIQIFTSLYKIFLSWVTKPENQNKITDMTHQIWISLKNIKFYILNLIESENDGVRTQVIKFMESLILLQSSKSADSYYTNTSLFSLDDVPERHKFLRYLQLQEESKHIFASLIKLCGSITISHSNLNTLLGSMTDIALQRPQYMVQILTALTNLYNCLPPTLAKSQVTSVKKGLKNRLLSLIKHPSSIESQAQVLPILLELGVSQNEINRNLPKVKAGSNTEHAKLTKSQTSSSSSLLLQGKESSEANLTAHLNQQLDLERVIDVVLSLLPSVPDTMPESFVKQYEPILRAGSTGHRTFLAQKMAGLIEVAQKDHGVAMDIADISEQKAQFYHGKDGPGKEFLINASVDEASLLIQASSFYARLRKYLQVGSGPNNFDLIKRSLRLRQFIRSVQAEFLKPNTPSDNLPPVVSQFLSNFDSISLCKAAVFRILFNSPPGFPYKIKLELIESVIAFKDVIEVPHFKSKSIISSTNFSKDTFDALVSFLHSNLDLENMELVIGILGQLYLQTNLHEDATPARLAFQQKYDDVFVNVLRKCLKDELLDCAYALITRTPIITDPILDIFYEVCCETYSTTAAGSETNSTTFPTISTIFTLCLKIADTRPALRQSVMGHVFFRLVSQQRPTDDSELRKTTLEFLVGLYETKNYGLLMERFALQQIRMLLDNPPSSSSSIEPDVKASIITTTTTWTEESIKLHLNLFLCLLPKNHKLITALSETYVQANAEVKRVILKSIETPIRLMGGIESDELMTLVRACPKGCETLVTRLVYIMATATTSIGTSEQTGTFSQTLIKQHHNKSISPVLLNAVRLLYYQKRLVTDVRILIPVIAGLNRQEIIALLPKFLALNNVNLIKEVLVKCCSTSAASGANQLLSPSELLVALHMIPTLVTSNVVDNLPSEMDTSLPSSTAVVLPGLNDETAVPQSATQTTPSTTTNSTCDTKALIRAINLCFANKRVFNAEIVSISIESLLEVEPLPMLFMRTVVQSIVQYPHLLTFIVEVLRRLVTKRVWTQPQAWTGFVKCCQKITQNALPLLLILPVDQLEDLLKQAPEFKDPIKEYVVTVIQAGRGADIPNDVLDFVDNDFAKTNKPKQETTLKVEAMDEHMDAEETPNVGDILSEENLIVATADPGHASIKTETMEIDQINQ